ncbi:5-oxoprolinase subunit PxpB [Salipaludibacillus sp. HK11]|uniref:5-oxoprolinase subunit PxpB n=1 Tax=Salipaludibacillus sp. HK11 TaxID=3394320 RepID=UPI0039FCFD43
MFTSCSPLGDCAVRFTFGEKLTAKTNDLVMKAIQQIKLANLPYITEMVPGYVTLTVYYIPSFSPPFDTVIQELKNKMEHIGEGNIQELKSRQVTLPVYYGGEQGPDLNDVASYHQINEQELIERHVASRYRVYMIGFAPGFPYLGGLNETIATPRRKTPRKQVSAGSVGIAGPQTGVYSVNSPGGWQIIGHTPVKLFDEKKQQPTLLKTGDHVTFKSVSKKEYDEIFQACKRGIYQPHIE